MLWWRFFSCNGWYEPRNQSSAVTNNLSNQTTSFSKYTDHTFKEKNVKHGMTAWNIKGSVFQFIKILCSWEYQSVCFTESEQQNSGQHKFPRGDDNAASGDILVPPAEEQCSALPGPRICPQEGQLGPQENIKIKRRAQEHKQVLRHSGPHVPPPPISDTQNPP